MKKTQPMSVAIESRSALLIGEIRKAVVDFGCDKTRRKIEIIPSEPLEGAVLGEPELLAFEAVRRAEIIRNVHKADLGISFVDGLVSAKTDVARIRRVYETVAIVVVAKGATIGVRFPPNTIPADLVDSLDTEMERVASMLVDAMTSKPDDNLYEIGHFLVNTLASFSYASDGESWATVH